MNEELKRKLYNYEAVPADKAWNKIASALDEEIDAQFPQKLYEAEVKPSSSVWNKILIELAGEKKEEYPAKLYTFEVSPPADAWQQIAATLDAEKTLPQIPRTKRVVPFVRYAAAACIIAAIAFGTVKLVMNQKSANRSVAEKTVPPQNLTPAIDQSRSNADSLSNTTAVVTNNLPKPATAITKANVVARKRSVARLISSPTYMALLAAPPAGISTFSSAVGFKHANLKIREVPGNCAAISEEDRYVNFMNPDGYLVRISKKLAEALKCYSPTVITPDNLCDKQIKKWRDKIARSFAASSDSFMDVLDIIKTAQEKEL